MTKSNEKSQHEKEMFRFHMYPDDWSERASSAPLSTHAYGSSLHAKSYMYMYVHSCDGCIITSHAGIGSLAKSRNRPCEERNIRDQVGGLERFCHWVRIAIHIHLCASHCMYMCSNTRLYMYCDGMTRRRFDATVGMRRRASNFSAAGILFFFFFPLITT